MAYHHVNIFPVNGSAQNQATGEWFIVLILFDDLPGINTLDNVIDGDTALHQTAAGVFCNGYLFGLVQRPQLFNLYHLLASLQLPARFVPLRLCLHRPRYEHRHGLPRRFCGLLRGLEGVGGQG